MNLYTLYVNASLGKLMENFISIMRSTMKMIHYPVMQQRKWPSMKLNGEKGFM